LNRDLKTDNILVNSLDLNSNKPLIALTDFGLSRDQDRPSLTKGFQGTVLWVAPEIFMECAATFKTDVYSYGILLWNLVTRTKDISIAYPQANSGLNFNSSLSDLIQKGIRPVISSQAKIQFDQLKEYQQLMENCWDTKPENRPDFEVIQDRLSKIMTNYEDLKKSTPPSPVIQQPLPTAPFAVEAWQFWSNKVGQEQMSTITDLVNNLAQYFNKNDKKWENELHEALSIFVNNDNNTMRPDFINYMAFQSLIQYFGPLKESKGLSFVDRMFDIFSKPWFFGYMEISEAENRLANSKPGTFLVRFSRTAGNFSITKMTNGAIINHIRIVVNPGSVEIVRESLIRLYTDVNQVIADPELELEQNCSGSPIFAKFTKLKSGVYVG